MSRRRFAFLIGLLLFQFARCLRAEKIDRVAAKLLEWSEHTNLRTKRRDRWRPNSNRTWKWFERQTNIDGQWQTSGLSTPVHRHTGKVFDRATGYLKDKQVPKAVRESASRIWKKLAAGRASPSSVLVEGQPPSKWLRSLNANELRLWLRTIRVPEVGVEEMSFWTHLTRDHSFSPDRIRGLSVEEQAKLHSAAHYGY